MPPSERTRGLNFDYQELLNRIPKKRREDDFRKHEAEEGIDAETLDTVSRYAEVINAFINFLTSEKQEEIICAGEKNGMHYELTYLARKAEES